MTGWPAPGAPNMDQAIALLRTMPECAPVVDRIMVTSEAASELFDAAVVVLDWMARVRPQDRPIALFNRLSDALNGVREAHQMEPRDARR